MSRCLSLSIAVLLALALPSAAVAKRSKKTVDPLALAKVLLLDGLPSRAMAVLAEVVPNEGAIDVKELYRLRGLAELELGRHAEAIADLKLALQSGERAAPTFYALAHAELGGGDAKAALATLERGPAEIWTLAGAYRVKALAHYKLGDRADRHRAFEAADAGLIRFPADIELERLRVLLLLELGLSQEGLEAGRRLLTRAEIKPKDYLTLASALASSRDLRRSAELLESALLRYPAHRDIREQLARTYFEAKRYLSAAQVLHPLALEESKSALLVAELYRRAGKIDAALRMNGLVADPEAKVRQRLNLLIEAERYHEAAALEDRLARLGLLADQKLLYALAYAQYVAGDKGSVEKLLGRISQPELFAKAEALRRALDTCRAEVWQCD